MSVLCGLKDKVAKLCKDVAALQANPAATPPQTLIPTVVGGETTQIEISGGNTIPILHPAPPVFPDQEVCDGPFVQRSSRTGWVFPWTPVATANTGTVTNDWVNVGSAEVAPDCVSDMAVSVFAGDHYFQIRRCRIYHWVDFRVLVNGAAVFTESYAHYEYLDQRSDTNPDVINPNRLFIRTGGPWFAERKNVPAGATVQVQMRRRYNFNAFQPSGRARAIGGLRSHALFTFSPRDIVTGRL